MTDQVLEALRNNTTPGKAEYFPRYFKCGPGEYGEGDKFIGVMVPQVRSIAKQFKHLEFDDLHDLLASEWHEARTVALSILVLQFPKADPTRKMEIVHFYLNELDRVNNWDLVDSFAGPILGEYLLDKDRSVLYELSQSGHLWRERVSIIATSAFIKRREFDDTLRLAKYFLTHKHDLMHKATGWMLREVGGKDRSVLTQFLQEHRLQMPRTMLRYAIEHYPHEERKAFLAKE